MIEIKNYNKIAKKPLDGLRGEKTLFQRILGRGSDKPDLMISLKGVAGLQSLLENPILIIHMKKRNKCT